MDKGEQMGINIEFQQDQFEVSPCGSPDISHGGLSEAVQSYRV